MEAGGTGQRVKDQYEDLELKWRKHGDRIKEFWRSFDQVRFMELRAHPDITTIFLSMSGMGMGRSKTSRS